jgi:hypothetical protein
MAGAEALSAGGSTSRVRLRKRLQWWLSLVNSPSPVSSYFLCDSRRLMWDGSFQIQMQGFADVPRDLAIYDFDFPLNC